MRQPVTRVPDELTGGPRFAAFGERYVRHTKGRWAGQPVVLEDWEREFFWEALEVDPVTGLRIYREVGLGLPRKNGKSLLASDFGTYLLVADGEAEPEIYVAAAARGQAGIVLGQSLRIVRQSPRLLRFLTPSAHRIDCPRNGGFMRAVSADAALQHGLNPHGNIIDELHAHPSPDLYTALTGGDLAREQPITLWISTAGEIGGTLWQICSLLLGFREPDEGESPPEGELELRNDGFLRIYRDRANGILIYWYGAPLDADPHDPAVWLGANPASWLKDGVTLRRTYGRHMARGALLEWRRYHLNQFVEATGEPWMPADEWRECAGDPVLRTDLPVYAVVRVAHDHRSAAVTMAQRQGEHVVLRTRMFPDGELPAGEYMDLGVVEAYLRRQHRRFPALVDAVLKSGSGRDYHRKKPGPEFASHGAFFERSAQRLRAEGLVMVNVPSTPQRVTPAAETLMQLVTSSSLVHDGHAELARQMDNVVGKAVAQGWQIGTKGGPIIAAQAAMLAADRAFTATVKPAGGMRRGLPPSATRRDLS